MWTALELERAAEAAFAARTAGDSDVKADLNFLSRPGPFRHLFLLLFFFYSILPEQ